MAMRRSRPLYRVPGPPLPDTPSRVTPPTAPLAGRRTPLAARQPGVLALLALVLTLLAAPAGAQQVPVAPTGEALPLLTIEEVTRLVLSQNPTLAIARLEQEVARVEATPGAAGFLPSVSISAVQRRVPTPAGRTDFRNETLDITASGRVTLFEGLARFTRLARLRTLVEVRDLDTEALTLALLAQAQVLYFDIAAQQERLVVLREAVSLSEERMRIATGRRDVGVASDLEVNRALVDLNADRAGLLRQEAALVQAKTRLNQLLNRPEATPFRSEDEIAIDRTLGLAEMRQEALVESPDLRAELAAERAAELQETAVRREFWPRLDLTLGFAFSELSDPLLPPAQTGGLSYGLAATFDVFDGFSRRRRLETSRLRTQQQEFATERTRTALLAGIESAYALYERSLALIDLEEVNVEAARQNAVVALERFRLGASTSIELREVQRALIDAESRLVAARFEAKAAEVDLRALTGRIVVE
jgi:outer membrane protein